ncbi:MAG: hypothetical protein QM528_01005 [Phycisphaerales bacterium]|nr:hypothetical protein [Phycisphaerales bacterium]
MNTQSSIVKVIECPRDAMQGIQQLIPTIDKINYVNKLLTVGFDTLDLGSFVSNKWVPQMADTAEVLGHLVESPTKILCIVVNMKGASTAITYDRIRYLGYPFSISPTFQKKNTNNTIDHALILVDELVGLCKQYHKTLVVYTSMGFGNPYSDYYSPHLLYNYIGQLVEKGVSIISLSDTTGSATPPLIKDIFMQVCSDYPQVEFGIHLHTKRADAYDKVIAALQAGCLRFDSTLGGIGGCPMAQNTLVGNLPTEVLMSILSDAQMYSTINQVILEESLQYANRFFKNYNYLYS